MSAIFPNDIGSVAPTPDGFCARALLDLSADTPVPEATSEGHNGRRNS